MSHSLSPTFYRLGRWFCRQTVGALCALRSRAWSTCRPGGRPSSAPSTSAGKTSRSSAWRCRRRSTISPKWSCSSSRCVRELLGAWGGVPVDRQNPRATLSSFRRLLPLLNQAGFHRAVPRRHVCRGPGRPRQASPDSVAPQVARPGGPGVPALCPRGGGLMSPGAWAIRCTLSWARRSWPPAPARPRP